MAALKITGQSAAPTVTASDAGTIYYDSTTNKLKIYDGTGWNILAYPHLYTDGGTITEYESGNVYYRVHSFLTVGTYIFDLTATVTADILVVAGGGGGGSAVRSPADNDAGGGGGAGGFVERSAFSLASGDYTVTVGGGGLAGTGQASGGYGGPAILGTITALGGGGGGGSNGTAGTAGSTGGSGGGGSWKDALGGSKTQGDSGGATGYGFDGGVGTSTVAGGGGGALEAGNTDGQQKGGDGKPNSIRTGSPVTYGGGGGGGGSIGAAPGSDGGGGAGGYNSAGGNGVSNTGGGGGGGEEGVGGAGGSGIVIIRYVL